ncbi:hypothetical protein Bbelb_394580 [Branchiostoma belcheri]|nr:hypothetical protein Bbelb_394580 [Branchiostoma belcheri]
MTSSPTMQYQHDVILPGQARGLRPRLEPKAAHPPNPRRVLLGPNLGEKIGAAKIISLRSHRDKSRHAASCHGAPTTIKFQPAQTLFVSAVKMYEQAQPVRFPVSGSGNNQTSGPQAQAPTVHQSGLHRRVSHGNGATDKRQEGIEMSSDTYEEPEAVTLSTPFREARLQRAKLRGEPPVEAADGRNTRRHVDLLDAMDTSTDRTYPGGIDGRRCVVRDCVPSYWGCLAGVTAVVVILVIAGLVVKVLNNIQEISHMSSTVDTLKRNIDDISQLSDTVGTLKRSMENLTDKCNLPSSCTEVGERSGFDNSRFYIIDPDGPGRGVAPMTVQCDLEGQIAITLIGHNSEARTHVNGFESPGSYSKDVTYWNSMEQVRALVDRSRRCKQHLKYQCYASMIWNKSSKPIAWWVTWDGRQADYWGGASPGSGKCACGETGACSGRCYCDNNDRTWREDSGYLTYKNDLPVTQLRFGDTGSSKEQGYHTLGKLICYP